MSRNVMIPVDVHIRRRSRKYMDMLLALNCAPDLLAHGLWPNSKEITESFAAFNAVMRLLGRFGLGDPDVSVVCVADGCTPRTAATFAFRTRWQCYSVDPALRSRGSWAGIDRLHVCPSRIEDWVEHPPFKRLIIVAVHPHCHLPAMLEALPSPDRAAVVMPCCVQQKAAGYPPPDHDYRDCGVWSPKDRILVWENI